MAMVWCDVASNGAHEKQYTAPAGALFPRVDVSLSGAWVAWECYETDCVVKSSAGENRDLGRYYGNNAGCVRVQNDGQFHVYMVADDDNPANTYGHGRHLVFGSDGSFKQEASEFNSDAAGSQGILDVTTTGEILWWAEHNSRLVDGLEFRNTRERGDYIVGTLQYDANNRVSVYVKTTGLWYRPAEINTQVLPGVNALGTISIQGDGGGFFVKSGWISSEFDPHTEAGVPDPGGPVLLPPGGVPGFDPSTGIILTGQIMVEATLKVYGPIGVGPQSGVTPLPPGAPTGPQPPGGGGGGGNLPEMAPNRMDILQQVKARQVWDFRETAQYEPNGRGAYTEAAVTALHDVDPRFGHVDKEDGTGPAPNRYNGHSVDAVCWKNPDGVTAEIIDIVTGANPGDIYWRWDSRTQDDLTKWKYPA